MMENKCNKTPNSNSKYLDHVYCHTVDNKTYIRANNSNSAASGGGGTGGTTTGADFLSLLKENKQLKAMLILHLELIQEQNDQLMSKDKQLASQGEELESLRIKNNQLEVHVQELQKQLQRQLKRVAVVSGERSSLPPPPLAKIQCKKELTLTSVQAASPAPNAGGTTLSTSAVPNKTANIIGECNGKLISKIILHRVSLPGRGLRASTSSPHSTTTSETASDADDTASKSQQDEDDEDDVDGEEEEGEEEEIEEEDEVEEEDADAGTGNTTTEDDSNDVPIATVAEQHAKNQRRQMPPLSLTIPRGAKPRTSIVITPPTSATAVSLQVCVTPPTPSRGKQMPLMRWHAPEIHSESESVSCDSLADVEHHSNITMTSPTTSKSSARSTTKATNARGSLGPPSHRHPQQRQTRSKTRRTTYISTPQRYSTREWEDEEFVCDYEFIKEEANALHADKPQLEIPKWTEHDLSPSYCIEGTEDLSDNTFLKRHAKFEVDEKRRKKWDVQQIREQRRIEKLKRRHCKDELLVSQEPQPLLSFYPQPDAIQNIYFSNELPVQAFGELIPKLNISSEFSLPWLEPHRTPTANCSSSNSSVVVLASSPVASGGNPNAANSTQTQHNSNFVFLKKRRRQQSSSTQNLTARQRSAAGNDLAAASPALATGTVAASPVIPTIASTNDSPSTPTPSDVTPSAPNSRNEATN